MKPEKEKTFIQLSTELLELGGTYLRQQLESIIETSVAKPLKRAGLTVAATILAAFVFGLAVIFIAVGLFLLLVKFVGAYWIAYLIIGASLLLIGILISIKGGSANE